MKPISVLNNRRERKKRVVKIRPLPQSKLDMFENWLKNFSWKPLQKLENSHKQAEYFQDTLFKYLQLYIPEKVVKFCNEDQPFFTPELKTLDRKRKHEFNRNRKSEKYKNLNKLFKKKYRQAKKAFYKNC